MSILFDGYRSQNPEYDILLDKRYKGIAGRVNAFHNSVSVNRKHNLPLKRLWYPSYIDYHTLNKLEETIPIIFIFFEGNRLAYQEEYLNYLKTRYPKSKYVFRFINIIDSCDLRDLKFVRKNYDMLISMDAADCRNYGIQYLPNTFWIDKKKIPSKPESDVVFIGNDKGRLKELIEVYQVLMGQGLDCQFFISSEKCNKNETIPQGIHRITKMDYVDYLGYVKNSKCILEIVMNHQQGSTLRALEAVFFNKMLISNNKYIKSESYYQRNLMYIYNKPEELHELKCSINKQIHYDETISVDHEKLFSKIKTYFGI